ncbi:MAG: terminase large subunit [Hoeflea sp.]|uniref:terminase large subunit n=1 Tax=Hoeflea sp. TaxID=1940281 RepID=UPI001DCDB3D7|nr:terminase TerL endonuclease subunit [Hoeflea sp.]MBU4529711.1 terminase large subunit [Alphaproteobacteria bacterium]MBU4543272.1 terminase large subunit [Alphaproteobacteria bacterium]MBU4552459.1 terminase large subunit [Alphaproteobacteria bacterium]MBV1723475.1 terminase large subunit [Hoeflea sp.]MBV1762924.1 terminase large subunit [Hoeflea sp.]
MTTTPLAISEGNISDRNVSAYPAWVFDDSIIPDPHGKGERAVKFLKALRHPKSTATKRAFQLDRWQERILRKVYGDTKPDGTRRIKTVFALIPRGNRKTTLGAALAMLHLGPERIPGSQVVSAAVDRDQARIALEEMKGVIGAHPRLAEAFQVQDTKNRIAHKRSGAFYRAMSADAATAHGRTPVFALVDELHAWKKRDLWDAIKTGLVKTPGSLLVVTTTAGIGHENIAHEMYKYAKAVATGQIEDNAFLPILFEADPEEDWRDEAVWHRVNPGLSCDPPYPDVDGMRQMVREAEHRPADREMFRQLHLNVWLDGAANPEWSLDVWDENSGELDLTAIEGRRAWIGVDLAKRIDLAAVSLAVPLADDSYALHVQTFCPEGAVRRRTDNVPYALWRDQGFLTVTPGDTIDLGMIEDYIRDLAERFQVEEIAFDRWHAQDIMKSLEDDGLPVAEFPQNIATFARPVIDFEALMFERRLVHGGNPMLRWAIGNVVLHTDASGNRRPLKERSIDKIDPAVAAIISIGRAAQGASGRSSYEDADLSDLSMFAV